MSTPARHSALGIAALVVSLCALVVFAITAQVGHNPAYDDMQQVPVALLVLLLIGIGLSVLALLLGLGSALQHHRRRVTGVLALGLSITLLWAQASLGSWAHQQWERAHPAPAAPPEAHAPGVPAAPLR